MRKKETLNYQIKGKMRLSAGDSIPSAFPFKSEGELSFDGILKQK